MTVSMFSFNLDGYLWGCHSGENTLGKSGRRKKKEMKGGEKLKWKEKWAAGEITQVALDSNGHASNHPYGALNGVVHFFLLR